jgi:general secretion pathway protein D
MKSLNHWKSIVSLVVLTCLLAVPVSALGKKGKDHFDRGMKAEQAQQWEKAAQEFTLAVAADPSNVDYQLHYRRACFNASQMFMTQGRTLAEQRDYVGAYNAFRQAFGYDPVNQLAVSEMERMLRLEEVKQGKTPTTNVDGTPNGKPSDTDAGGTPANPTQTKTPETDFTPKPEAARVINYSGDLKAFIRQYAEDLNLNVIFDRQTFATPRSIDVHLRDVTVAKALDYIFLQEGLFFQKLDRRTILVADQSRRAQYQQLVVRTFYLGNAKPAKAKEVISQALPASVGRPQPITVIDEDTNSLTVRDTAENVRLIGDLLEGIDKDRAEVVMDVSIYEVSRSSLLQVGNQLGQGNFNLGGSPGIALLTDNGTASTTAPGVNLSGLVAGSPTAWAAALIMPSSVLTAFQSKNNSKLLASTQIHAFNNEESTARIGQRVPVQTAQAYPFGVQTGTTGTTTPGQTNFPTGGFPVINYEPTGLTLNFTPIVFPNLDVQVKMKISSKDVSGASTLTPTFTERELTGTARVQNNRTMMLASVSQDIQATGRQGLPLISGLPLVGRLFSSPTRDNRNVDIVIAVTPRVLRAPAITPRDLEMRQSGTLQAPTTGSLEAMLIETQRDEMIAAARRLPKNPVVEVKDPAPAYEPATKEQVASATTNQTTNNQAATNPASSNATTTAAPANQTASTNNAAMPQVQNVSTPAITSKSTEALIVPNDGAVPQPKSAAFTAQDVAPPKSTTDVATALQSIVTAPTNVATTNLSANQTTTIAPASDLAPKSEVATAKMKDPESGVIELALDSGKDELKVGEKRLVAVQLKSDAPLGMALVTLRFDPKVLKINSITPGSLFANAKTAPTLTQSIDEHGMVLISLTPAAGSATMADGTLLNIDVEAIASGDTNLNFDLSNIHLVASDGRAMLLQIEPVKLTVKQ